MAQNKILTEDLIEASSGLVTKKQIETIRARKLIDGLPAGRSGSPVRYSKEQALTIAGYAAMQGIKNIQPWKMAEQAAGAVNSYLKNQNVFAYRVAQGSTGSFGVMTSNETDVRTAFDSALKNGEPFMVIPLSQIFDKLLDALDE